MKRMHTLLPEIRPAVSNDLFSILLLYKDALQDDKILSEAEAMHIFKTMQTYPSYTIYVALVQGRIIGTFALLIMENLGHNGAKSAVIEDVAVGSEFQGQGIGKRMMQFAMEKCREEKCYKVSLSSNLIREKTHAFYESLGFRKHGFSFWVDL
ncbi:GNAT family N-acetyltransferase [Siphonobacter sp. SORGH_AS_0500]|uniref:GNAT family N-acetyltransferase n=1 Tax=Siphonobacter sp. SORGH_AS_0500 TaxID=1864824 RepID=UPI002861CF60|nr:GNAT family N-acetyltransferase [Siphonobacter sp. SORGH_AS_0500]MDR6196039.1 GNAT superfamily N-acetyltransferase [Siphonobacter sp. SORGH_AS_0500]